MNLKTEHFCILTTSLLRSSRILGRSAVRSSWSSSECDGGLIDE